VNGLVDHALDYAARGWAVFPCDPCAGAGCKRPLVKRDRDANGQPVPKTGGLYKASKDAEQIRSWWTRWPDALIGVRMGSASGVWAIDPDAPKEAGDPDGRAAWQELVERFGGPPATHSHVTPGGGFHFLFRWRADRPMSNREGGLAGTGINVRGEGGYLIVPPSRLVNGGKYLLAESLDFFRFADAPEWLYDLILGRSKPKVGGAAPVAAASVPQQGALRSRILPNRKRLYVAAAFTGECRNVASAVPRTRNKTLNAAAFKLGSFVGGGHLDEPTVVSRLLEAAEACGLVADDGRQATLATIRSGLTAGVKHPREIPEARRQPEPRHDGDSVLQDGQEVEEGAITQDGVARVFARRFAGRLRFDHHAGAWFEWVGTHWRRDEKGRAFQLARELAREFSEHSCPTDLKEVRKVSFAAGVERFARSDSAFAVTSELWDQDPFLLGTPGGTIDLRTGALREPEPADGITKVTAVTPAERADCPLWLRFLGETFGGDAELIRFTQQWGGYALTADTREHALLFGYGSGGNGKSVWLNVHTGIMHDYATTAGMDTFVASTSERHPTDLAMLRGARLVTASETEEGRAWAESRIKSLTGGDPISARFMRQDFFTFLPSFKLTVIGNHKPVLRNVDEAARRRFNLLPFVLRPAVPDRELEQKLRAEWPGILRWLIDGCLDWQANGLVRPPAVIAATQTYFDDQDLLSQWLEEECDAEPGNRFKTEAVAALFESWSSYATKAGERPSSKKSFSEMLTRKGLEPYRGSGGVRSFRGVRLRPSTPFGSDK
jgi:putative DNA primase/helicase